MYKIIYIFFGVIFIVGCSNKVVKQPVRLPLSPVLNYNGKTFYTCPTAKEIKANVGKAYWENKNGISWAFDKNADKIEIKDVINLEQVIENKSESVSCVYRVRNKKSWFITMLQPKAFNSVAPGGNHWKKCDDNTCLYVCKTVRPASCPFLIEQNDSASIPLYK